MAERNENNENFIYQGQGTSGSSKGEPIYLTPGTEVSITRISLTDPNLAFVQSLEMPGSVFQVKRDELQHKPSAEEFHLVAEEPTKVELYLGQRLRYRGKNLVGTIARVEAESESVWIKWDSRSEEIQYQLATLADMFTLENGLEILPDEPDVFDENPPWVIEAQSALREIQEQINITSINLADVPEEDTARKRIIQHHLSGYREQKRRANADASKLAREHGFQLLLTEPVQDGRVINFLGIQPTESTPEDRSEFIVGLRVYRKHTHVSGVIVEVAGDFAKVSFNAQAPIELPIAELRSADEVDADEEAQKLFEKHNEENQCLDIADYSPELVDLSEQPKLSEESPPSNLLRLTPQLNESYSISSQELPSTQTSGITTQPQENLISLPAGGPATTPALQEIELELMEDSQSSGGKCSELSVLSDQNLLSWNNLKDLSSEDFAQCLEDSEWLDIYAGIYNSYQQRNSERRISATDYLSCPTPTSSDGKKSRPAGVTKYEQWFKDKGIVPTGSQLSAQAMSLLLGFPVDWMNALSPYHPDIPAGSTPESLLGEPLPPGKQQSPSDESSTLIPVFKDDRESLQIALIKRDGGTQSRSKVYAETVQEYVEALLAGDKFPPIIVYYDGSEYWLADGFHRLDAYIACRQETIPVTIRQGTRRDAVLHSVGANATHGLRRTNQDKRRAVELLLNDAEWGEWSNREIAKACGVDHTFVGKLRVSLVSSTSDNLHTTRRYTDRYGNTSAMNVGGLSARSTTGDSEALPPRADRTSKKPPDPKWKDAHLTSTPNPPSINYKAGDTVELVNPPPESGWSPGSKVVIAEVFHDSQAILIDLDETQTNLFKRFSFDQISPVQFRPPDFPEPSPADELREQVHQQREDVATLMAQRDELARENSALKQERVSFLRSLGQLAIDVETDLRNRVKPGTRIQHVNAGLGTVIETPSGQAPGLWIQLDHGNRNAIEPTDVKPMADDIPDIDFPALSDMALQAIIESAARELERRASLGGEP